MFKVDFEKAYDHVRWSCLDKIMEKKGFGNRWRKRINGCISTANFSIMINGKPRGRFGASRGLRQACPLSPFLFTLVVDMFGRLMDKAYENGVIKGFTVGREAVHVSHLQFADDTLFLLDAKSKNLRNANCILKFFSVCSTLNINMEKSSLVGINLDDALVDSLASRLGCVESSWPIKYLGLPLGGNPMSTEFWRPVMEKVTKRLDW